MTKYKFLNILFVLALVLSYAGVSMAQEDGAQSGDSESIIVNDPILGARDKKFWAENRNSKDNRYAKTTYQNLSKMYWAIYALKLNDDEAIDNYLRINECDLWEKYYHSDFQWEEIREVTRKLIAKSRHTYPRKFEILLPLSLGRYNIEREIFEIQEETQFKNMKKIDTSLTPQSFVCNSGRFLEGYPGTAILILDRPFHFVEIPVKPELARLYIQEADEKYEHMDLDMKLAKYERQAYLRVLVSFNSYVSTVVGAAGIKKAVIHAKIDAIEVYADSQNTKPLYIKDFSEIRRRRKDRVLDATTNQDVNKAFEGLLSSEEENFDERAR